MEFLEGLDNFAVKQWDVGTARCRADPGHPQPGCTAEPALGQPTPGTAVPSGGTGDVSAAWDRLFHSEAAGRSLKHRHRHRDRQGELSLLCWQRAACPGLPRQLLPSTITGWERKELLTWSDRRSFSKVSSSCAFSSL